MQNDSKKVSLALKNLIIPFLFDENLSRYGDRPYFIVFTYSEKKVQNLNLTLKFKEMCYSKILTSISYRIFKPLYYFFTSISISMNFEKMHTLSHKLHVCVYILYVIYHLKTSE